MQKTQRLLQHRARSVDVLDHVISKHQDELKKLQESTSLSQETTTSNKQQTIEVTSDSDDEMPPAPPTRGRGRYFCQIIIHCISEIWLVITILFIYHVARQLVRVHQKGKGLLSISTCCYSNCTVSRTESCTKVIGRRGWEFIAYNCVSTGVIQGTWQISQESNCFNYLEFDCCTTLIDSLIIVLH